MQRLPEKRAHLQRLFAEIEHQRAASNGFEARAQISNTLNQLEDQICGVGGLG